MKYLKIIILFFSITVFSQSGKVVKIKDGDTIVVLDSFNVQTIIRLAEVDCPESSQPFGKNAKVFYSGKYLSEEIIKNGFGWHYKKYSNSKKLAALEELAHENKKGLWMDNRAIAPWDWRKKN